MSAPAEELSIAGLGFAKCSGSELEATITFAELRSFKVAIGTKRRWPPWPFALSPIRKF